MLYGGALYYRHTHIQRTYTTNHTVKASCIHNTAKQQTHLVPSASRLFLVATIHHTAIQPHTRIHAIHLPSAANPMPIAALYTFVLLWPEGKLAVTSELLRGVLRLPTGIQ